MRAAKIGVAFFFVVALLLIIPFPPLSLPRLPNHARRQPHGPIGAGEHYARRVAGLVDLDGRAAVGLQRLDGVSGPANDPADARPGDEEHEGALRRAGSWRRRGKGWIMLMEDSGVLLVVLRMLLVLLMRRWLIRFWWMRMSFRFLIRCRLRRLLLCQMDTK